MADDLKTIGEDLAGYDESNLIEMLGIRARQIQSNHTIAGEFSPDVTYDAKFMGPLDDIKALGLRILNRWNRELFNIVCGASNDDKEDRTKILNALTLGEGAAIAALIPVLTGLGLAPALAAVLAAIIVKRFLGTALDTICDAWGQQVKKT
ncbi:hypothetical protein [Bradyrhizobium sp. SZCCHNRI1029]|uniref:hypothetical protein n=1 Tax=Bradyrhizobium sp. SZCCHNRI1029 TaxID=3057278 RepID=UPI002916E7C5|nr:hypothetical protein [Bradyrhizobium sp. SZCCHNRI1029]